MPRTVAWWRRRSSSKRATALAAARRPVPHHPRQVVPLGGRGRHRVHLLLLHELEAVLDLAQEPVRLGQAVGVVAVDVAGVGQLGQRGQRRRHTQPGVERPVHELEQLHRELDVADAAGAELDLALAQPPPGHLGLRPLLHRPHGPQRLGVEGPRPQPGARPRPRTVRPTPASPATGAALRSAWNSHGCAQRSQYASNDSTVRTSGPSRPSGRRFRSTRKHRRATLDDRPGPPLERVLVALADEEDVDVAGVVQLAGAQLAHADDREPVALGLTDGGREDVRPPSPPAPRPRLPTGRCRAGRGRRCAGTPGSSMRPGRRRRQRRPVVERGEHVHGRRVPLEQSGQRTARFRHGDHGRRQLRVRGEPLVEAVVGLLEACQRNGGPH